MRRALCCLRSPAQTNGQAFVVTLISSSNNLWNPPHIPATLPPYPNHRYVDYLWWYRSGRPPWSIDFVVRQLLVESNIHIDDPTHRLECRYPALGVGRTVCTQTIGFPTANQPANVVLAMPLQPVDGQAFIALLHILVALVIRVCEEKQTRGVRPFARNIYLEPTSKAYDFMLRIHIHAVVTSVASWFGRFLFDPRLHGKHPRR